MLKKSLKKNYFFKVSLLLINMLFPLITAPYISRVLGIKNLGEINFSQSILSIMIIIIGLGIPIYGIREVAKVKNNRDELSKIFSELFILSLISTIFFMVIYFIIIYNLDYYKNVKKILYIFGIGLSFNFLSIEWFYSGIEEFSYITFRGMIVKLLALIGLFIFVRTSNDNYNYVWILALSTIIPNIINIIYSNKFITFRIKKIKIYSHLLNMKYFYITQLMGAIYGYLDIVILGILSSANAVAIHTRSKMIAMLIVQIIATISTVLVPRLSFEYKNNNKEYHNLIETSFDLMLLILLPFSIILFLFSQEIMFILGGNAFAQNYLEVRILALWVIIVSFSIYIDNQISIPIGKEKITTISCICVAIITTILNFYLIPKYSYIGAGISLIIGDFIGFILQLYFTKKILKYRLFKRKYISYLFINIGLMVIMIMLKGISNNIILKILISGIGGIIFYSSCLIYLKHEMVMDLLRKIIKNGDKNENIDNT